MSFQEFALSFLAVSVILIVALLPLAVFAWTLFDVIFRVDIGVSKLFWLGLVLMLPVAGLVAYWLLRPKRYDPLYEKGDDYYTVQPGSHPAQAMQPATLVVVCGSGRHATEEEPAAGLKRAA